MSQHNYGICLEHEKAFDNVNHAILLQKLYQYLCSRDDLRLVKNYLTSRSQYVTVNKRDSNTLEIKCVVPHGSV